MRDLRSSVWSSVDTVVPPPRDSRLRFKRIILKFSGEASAGAPVSASSPRSRRDGEGAVHDVWNLGVQVGIVVGGGNIFRGLSAAGMDRAQSDHMGMLATVMNLLALQDALEQVGVPTRADGDRDPPDRGAVYIRRRAIRPHGRRAACHLAAGTGNPYSRPTPPPGLRDGGQRIRVLQGDEGRRHLRPIRSSTMDARMYDHMSFDKFINDRIGVMDATAATLCRDNNMPIRVFC